MSIIIRPATLDDVAHLVPHVKEASGGFSEFLLGNLVPHMSVEELIEMALTDEHTIYYYTNFWVAEQEHAIIGASHFFPAEHHGLPDLMKSMIAKAKLDIIAPYLNSFIPDSMYINMMAVSKTHRSSLCSLLMGKKIEALAKQQKKRCLSAHVWRENTLVYDGLRLARFTEEHVFFLTPQPEFTYKGAMTLMKGPDFE